MQIYRGFYQTIPELKNIRNESDVTRAMELLDSIEDQEMKTEISGSMVPCPVSVASFLLGYCGNLAEYLHREFGYHIGILYLPVEGAVSVEHVFNTARIHGKKVYIDSRGITSDRNVFMSLYTGMNLVEKEFQSLKKAEKWAGAWPFVNDKISDAMIGWLVKNHPDYYIITKRR